VLFDASTAANHGSAGHKGEISFPPVGSGIQSFPGRVVRVGPDDVEAGSRTATWSKVKATGQAQEYGPGTKQDITRIGVPQRPAERSLAEDIGGLTRLVDPSTRVQLGCRTPKVKRNGAIRPIDLDSGSSVCCRIGQLLASGQGQRQACRFQPDKACSYPVS